MKGKRTFHRLELNAISGCFWNPLFSLTLLNTLHFVIGLSTHLPTTTEPVRRFQCRFLSADAENLPCGETGSLRKAGFCAVCSKGSRSVSSLARTDTLCGSRDGASKRNKATARLLKSTCPLRLQAGERWLTTAPGDGHKASCSGKRAGLLRSLNPQRASAKSVPVKKYRHTDRPQRQHCSHQKPKPETAH